MEEIDAGTIWKHVKKVEAIEFNQYNKTNIGIDVHLMGSGKVLWKYWDSDGKSALVHIWSQS